MSPGLTCFEFTTGFYSIISDLSTYLTQSTHFDATYIDDTLGPSGEYGFRTRRTFGGQNKNGVVIRLDGEDDSFQLIVQDDLTGLTFMEAVAQGHVVD